MTTTTERLDADELLHLAIRASEANQHESSISYLKRALEIAPKNGKIHYMLGAEHAQIGLYDRAIEEMTRAVELDGSLHTATFQLGLLYITSGMVANAATAWQPLDKLGDNDALYLFKTGLLHLARDEFQKAIEMMRKGIELNKTNEALNRDMQRLITDAEKQLTTPAAKPAPEAGSKDKGANHVLLSAYRQNRSDDGD